ncbi:MAG: hypothetical protein ACXQTI_06165 [Candidatus Nezhaarchaeales archaeon]
MRIGLNLKIAALIGLMGALGNALFAISAPLLSWTGGAIGISLDLSHIGTIIAAIFGGPIAGFLTGLIVGLLPGVWFGFIVGGAGALALLCLPIGKALTGLTVGALSGIFKVPQRSKGRSLLTLASTLLGYIPEMLFTMLYFMYLVPIFVGFEMAIAFMIPIIIKAWIEMGVIGLFTASLVGNQGFIGVVEKYFAPGWSTTIKSHES